MDVFEAPFRKDAQFEPTQTNQFLEKSLKKSLKQVDLLPQPEMLSLGILLQ